MPLFVDGATRLQRHHDRFPSRICRALNQAGARYLLIAGSAVVAHGAGRFTTDIELLIDDSPENVCTAYLDACRAETDSVRVGTRWSTPKPERSDP